MKKEKIDLIVNFVKLNSYFEYEGEENGILEFATRKNGSVSYETASTKDINEGKKLKKELLDKFKNLEVEIDIVDEWILIFVSKFKEKIDQYQYAFIKDLNGCGFGEGFDSMELLIKRFGTWVDVDWNVITKKVEAINEYPEDRFTGWFSSNKMLIKKAGEEGNDWGYNFYIKKSKRVL